MTEQPVKDVTVRALHTDGTWKFHTFKDITELDAVGSGSKVEPWYVLIGQRLGTSGGNQVVERVVRVREVDECKLDDGPLPRTNSATGEDLTVAQEQARNEEYPV